MQTAALLAPAWNHPNVPGGQARTLYRGFLLFSNCPLKKTALLRYNHTIQVTHLKCTIPGFLVYSEWCNITTINFRPFSSPPKKFSPCRSHPPSSLRQPLMYFLSPQVCLFLRFRVNKITYVSYCVWRFHLAKCFQGSSSCSMYQYFIARHS